MMYPSARRSGSTVNGEDSVKSESDSRDSEGSESSSSSDGDSSTEENSKPLFRNGASGLVSSLRRRGTLQSAGPTLPLRANSEERNEKNRRDRRRVAWHRLLPVDRHRLPVWCSCFASFLLSTSFLLWLAMFLLQEPTAMTLKHTHQDGLTIRERTRIRTGEKALTDKSAAGVGGFIQDVRDGFQSIVGTEKFKKIKDRNNNMERLAPSCVRADWQSLSFPNCNEIHEIDLEAIRSRQKAGNETVGALSNGFWRTVWAVDPRPARTDLLALKIMKGEHDVDERNFDRHRRDALTMERLTSSPNIVDIFSYCGNSVLTEWVDKTLQDVVIDAKEINSMNSTVDVYPTRKTPEGRLRLALDVARGLEAIHSIPGGPIVHADLTTKQFLVTADGTVKLNDFNRCRFMASRNQTEEPCPFRVPQSPGKYRAPEEYKEQELDEKIDIYSGANVLYSIMTGQVAWTDWSTMETKKMVKDGVMPFIPEEFRQASTIDMALTHLTESAYQGNPHERTSAATLVKALERLAANSTKAVSNVPELDRP